MKSQNPIPSPTQTSACPKHTLRSISRLASVPHIHTHIHYTTTHTPCMTLHEPTWCASVSSVVGGDSDSREYVGRKYRHAYLPHSSHALHTPASVAAQHLLPHDCRSHRLTGFLFVLGSEAGVRLCGHYCLCLLVSQTTCQPSTLYGLGSHYSLAASPLSTPSPRSTMWEVSACYRTGRGCRVRMLVNA